MISDISMIAQDDVFITYKKDGNEGEILFSEIRQYWDYSNADEFEGGFSKVIDGNRILAVMLVASRQGGAVIVWDAENGKLDHISQADYCEAVTIYNDEVYTLAIPSGFFEPQNAVIEKCKYGTRNISTDLELVKELPIDTFEDYAGTYTSLDLIVDSDGIRVNYQGEEIIKMAI